MYLRPSPHVTVLGLALATFLAACTGQISGGESAIADDDSVPTPPGEDPPVEPPPADAKLVTVDFEESDAELDNPERGFYVGLNLLSPGNAAAIRADGHTMAIALVRLDDYRDKALDADLLESLDQGLAAARAAGLKVILRFMYNSAFEADASKARILGHIAQLEPLLQNNADVISVMQAGFIGAWGEWHSSTTGLDNDGDRSAIVNAILAALPASRTVQVRTPMYKAGMVTSSALTADEAFSGSARARIGHHNDCFLASESDFGTYASPVAQWQSYIAQESRFLPMGGETCAVSARTDCAVAVAEMKTNHWSYLNQQYHQDVLEGWETQGCAAEIRRRLGYRFALQRAVHSEAVAPGGELYLQVDAANTGFASPYNQRPIYVVLSGGGKRHVAKLGAVDVRRWEAGEAIQFSARLRVPADLAAGTYKLGLWFPDEASALRNDPRFAIRLANDGVWDDATGDNVITETLTIDASAPGAVDASATTFAELP